MITFDESLVVNAPINNIWDTVRQHATTQGEITIEVHHHLLAIRRDNDALIYVFEVYPSYNLLRRLVSDDPKIIMALQSADNPTAYLNDSPHSNQNADQQIFDDDFTRLVQSIPLTDQIAPIDSLPTVNPMSHRRYFGSSALIVGGFFGGVIVAGIFAGLNWFAAGRKRLAWLTLLLGFIILPVVGTILLTIMLFIPALAPVVSFGSSVNSPAILNGGILGILTGTAFAYWQRPLLAGTARHSLIRGFALCIGGIIYSIFFTWVIVPQFEPFITPIVALATPHQTFSEEGITFDYPGGWLRQTDLSPLDELCNTATIECLWWVSIFSFDTGMVAYRVSSLMPTNVTDVASQMPQGFRNQLPNIRQLQNINYEVDGHDVFEQIYVTGSQKILLVLIQDGWGVLIFRLEGSATNVDRLTPEVRAVIDSVRFIDE